MWQTMKCCRQRREACKLVRWASRRRCLARDKDMSKVVTGLQSNPVTAHEINNNNRREFKSITLTMVMITDELYEQFNTKFPQSMTFGDIASEIGRMSRTDAERYAAVACNELFLGFCVNYHEYNAPTIEAISGSEEYRIFKQMLTYLEQHCFYDAWCAFLEGRRQAVRKHIHEYLQTFISEEPPYGETDVALGVLLAFKNAFEGFWPYVKKEIEAIPHDEIAAQLCDVIEAFYNAPTNEDALEVLISAYQRFPDSPTINEMLGVVYYDEKQYGSAAAAFERLYDEESGTYNSNLYTQDQIFFFLGYANDKLKDRKAAISYYEKAVELYPTCPYAANNLGYDYYLDKQYDKSYEILKRCLDEELEQEIVYPVTNFARLLYAMGRYKEAKEFIKTAPARVPKSIREKIEKAPDKNLHVKQPLSAVPADDEDGAEPAAKVSIERKGSQFQSEKLLEDELTMRMEAGLNVFGLPLKIYRRRGEYGRQYIFPEGRLDILAEDSDENLYIIELKKDSGYDDAYRQLVQYIDWF